MMFSPKEKLASNAENKENQRKANPFIILMLKFSGNFWGVSRYWKEKWRFLRKYFIKDIKIIEDCASF